MLRRVLIAAGACLLLLLATAMPNHAAEKTPVLAIRDATIIPQPGTALEHATIVIQDGRIAVLGTDAVIPEFAKVIEGEGLFVYAGFIDAASGIGIPKAAPEELTARREGETDSPIEGPIPTMAEADRSGVTPDWRAREAYAPAPEEREAHRSKGFTVAHITPDAAILGGQSTVALLNDKPLRDGFLADDVAHFAGFSAGSGERQFGNQNYPATTMGCVALFRQTWYDADWYQASLAWAKAHPEAAAALPSDPGLAALWQARAEGRTFFFAANSPTEIPRALSLGEEFGLRAGILGGASAWRFTDRWKQSPVPMILSVRFPDEPYPSPDDKPKKAAGKGGKRGGKKGKRGGDAAPDAAADSAPESETATEEPETPAEPEAPKADKDISDEKWESLRFESAAVRDERRRMWLEDVQNMQRLHEAGVDFSIGTRDLRPVDDFYGNLRRAIREGLPADAALAALTVQPARLLGLEARLGTLAPGKLANLTVFTGPFEQDESKVVHVVVAGEDFNLDPNWKFEPRKEDAQSKAAPETAPEAAAEQGTADAAAGTTNDTAAVTDESTPESPATDPAATTEARPAKSEDVWPEYATETEADRKPGLRTGGSVLLTHATIFPVTSPRQDDMSILVENGVIRAIGRDLAAPAGVTVIDLTGCSVMPGILDPHSHIAVDGNLNEYTMSITPEVRVSDIIDHRDVTIHRALAGGCTAAHLMHGSANTIGGQCVLTKLQYDTSAERMFFSGAPRTVKFALGENVTQANSPDLRGKRYPNTRMGVESTMRQAFHRAEQYRRKRDADRAARERGETPPPFRRDIRMEALCDILDGGIHIHCHCYRADEILRLLAVAEDYGVRVAALHHVLEAYRILPEIARHGSGLATFSDWWSYKVEAANAIPYNAAMGVRAGVATALKSDSPDLIRHMPLEAAKSLRFGGLNEDECLAMITLEPARLFHVDNRVGSLEIGKDADLAVFDGHPLDTFSKTVLTFIEGEAFFVHPEFDPARTAPAAKPLRQFPASRAPLALPEQDTGAYAIVGATVHPVSGPVLEGGVVVIENGVITAVGATAAVPPGATVIDAAGLHLYPGLINAGTSLGILGIGAITPTVDTSEISPMDPAIRASSAVDPHNVHIEVSRAEGVLVALTLPQGAGIAGQASLLRMSGWTMPDMLVDDGVALMLTLPSLPVEPGMPAQPDKRKELLDNHEESMRRIRDYFEFARRYAAALAKGESPETESFAPGLDLDAMLPFVRRERPVFFTANSYKEIREALRFADTYELRPVIFGGREAWTLAGLLAERGIPVVLDSVFDVPHSPLTPWNAPYTNAAALEKAGVRFCFATLGGPFGGAGLAKLLPLYAGFAVAHGLSEERALRAVTLDAAGILGIDRRLGSIETGKEATLILCTDTPLQACNRVVAAWVAGKAESLDSLHERHYQRFLNRPQPQLPPERKLNGPESITHK